LTVYTLWNNIGSHRKFFLIVKIIPMYYAVLQNVIGYFNISWYHVSFFFSCTTMELVGQQSHVQLYTREKFFTVQWFLHSGIAVPISLDSRLPTERDPPVTEVRTGDSARGSTTLFRYVTPLPIYRITNRKINYRCQFKYVIKYH